MDINNLKQYVELSKSISSEYVYFKDNMIYGTDENFSILYKMNSDYDIELSYSNKDGKSFVKNATKITDIKGSILYNDSTNDKDVKELEINNISMKYKINNMINNIKNMLDSTNNIFYIENILENYKFKEMLNKKSDEGNTNIVIENNNDYYIMYLSKILFPIVKKDKQVEVKIYDLDDTMFLSEFIIHKKDLKRTITLYILFKKLQ